MEGPNPNKLFLSTIYGSINDYVLLIILTTRQSLKYKLLCNISHNNYHIYIFPRQTLKYKQLCSNLAA
jgi:hypothetical protein